MMTRRAHWIVMCLAVFVVACAGRGPTPVLVSRSVSTQKEVPSRLASSEPVRSWDAKQGESTEHAGAADTTAASSTGPFRPTTAEQIHQALVAASTSERSLRRLIDASWGVGTIEPSDSGAVHHCDPDEVASHPGMSFTVHEEDRFRCDSSLERCTASDPAGGGYAFYWRRDASGNATLDTIVHHRNRPPARPSRNTRSFVGSGDGVCALWRELRNEDGDYPSNFSVFVASQTGLVHRTLDEHFCGEEAAAAFEEHLEPLISGRPQMGCGRGPTRCSFRRGDEEIVIYAEGTLPGAVAITRHGMFANLARAQSRALSTFLRNRTRHSCD